MHAIADTIAHTARTVANSPGVLVRRTPTQWARGAGHNGLAAAPVRNALRGHYGARAVQHTYTAQQMLSVLTHYMLAQG